MDSGLGKDRIRNMVEGRADWCISRQRSWGVPITAVYCKTCGKVVVIPISCEAIVALVEKEGMDGWFKHQAQDVLSAGSNVPAAPPTS